MLYHSISCHITAYHFIWQHIMPNHTVSCHITAYHAKSHRIMPYHSISWSHSKLLSWLKLNCVQLSEFWWRALMNIYHHVKTTSGYIGECTPVSARISIGIIDNNFSIESTGELYNAISKTTFTYQQQRKILVEVLLLLDWTAHLESQKLGILLLDPSAKEWTRLFCQND